MAEPQLPQSSAIRVFINGVLQPERQVGQGPGRVVATAEALAAGRQPSASQEPQAFSVGPTRVWINGVQQAMPQQQPYSPPPQDASLAPRCVLLEGSPLERSAAPLADPRVQRQQALDAARDQNRQDAYRGTYENAEGVWVPYSDAERKEQQRLENQFAKCESYCRTHGLAALPTEVEYHQGNFLFRDDASAPPAPPAAPEAAP
jgi:hypothetical protein